MPRLEGFEWIWVGLMGLVMVAFWVAVIAGIVFLVRWVVARSGPGSTSEASALEILKRRYARGEIGKDEYEAKKRDIM